MVVDTGAARTLVRRDLIPHKQIKRSAVTVSGLVNMSRALRLADIHMEIYGRPTTTEVAVDPTLPYLGRDIPFLIQLLTDLQPQPMIAVVQTRRQKAAETRQYEEDLQAELGNSEPDPNRDFSDESSTESEDPPDSEEDVSETEEETPETSATEEETTLTDELPDFSKDMFTEELKQKTD